MFASRSALLPPELQSKSHRQRLASNQHRHNWNHQAIPIPPTARISAGPLAISAQRGRSLNPPPGGRPLAMPRTGPAPPVPTRLPGSPRESQRSRLEPQTAPPLVRHRRQRQPNRIRVRQPHRRQRGSGPLRSRPHPPSPQHSLGPAEGINAIRQPVGPRPRPLALAGPGRRPSQAATEVRNHPSPFERASTSCG